MNKVYISMPTPCEDILEALSTKGFPTYIVGGCVRDSMMEQEPKDWDICTSAKPEQVKEIFSDRNKGFQVIETGIKHGTVTLMNNFGDGYEVTTFRVDGDYSDNRRPDSVDFVDDVIDDLARRDFTINAMAYNEEEGLIDPFKGIDDIDAGVIRCVGDPNKRFQEDALRMMRAIRFSARFDFRLDGKTKIAISKNAELIKNVSQERINSELNQILLADNNKLVDLWSCGLMKHILPEVAVCFGVEQKNPFHIYDVGMHTVKSVEFIEPYLHLKLAMLLHDIGKPSCMVDKDGTGHFPGHGAVSARMAEEALKRLRYSNDIIERVVTLIKYHDATIEETPTAVRRWINKIGEEGFIELMMVRRADIKAQNPELATDRLEKIFRLTKICHEIVTKKECLTLKDLAINGNDIIAINRSVRGKRIGEILRGLLDIVLENPEVNKRETLLKIVNMILE